jgi:hypothetical protein
LEELWMWLAAASHVVVGTAVDPRPFASYPGTWDAVTRQRVLVPLLCHPAAAAPGAGPSCPQPPPQPTATDALSRYAEAVATVHADSTGRPREDLVWAPEVVDAEAQALRQQAAAAEADARQLRQEADALREEVDALRKEAAALRKGEASSHRSRSV